MTSNKNVIVIIPVNPKYKNINQTVSWKSTKEVKLKDSVINTRFSISNPKNISKFKTNRTVLIEASIAYLFLLKNPVSIIQKLNKIDNKAAYTVLYSISNILKLGPQTELIQNE